MLRARRWPLTILATTACAAVLGCGSTTPERSDIVGTCPDVPPGDGGAPVLGGAALVSGEQVCLAFSEAIVPPIAVDPEAFRISRAVTVEKGSPVYQACSCGFTGDPPPCYTCLGSYATYAECSNVAYDAFDDAARCVTKAAADAATIYYDITDELAARGRFDRLERTSPREVLGTLADALTDAICVPGASKPAGRPKLFLHYAGATPPLVSEAGDALAPIAPAFARSSRPNLRVPGSFPGHAVPVDDHLLTALCTNGDACSDRIQDEFETDVDCGGFCQPCDRGRHCLRDSDCASRSCDDDGHCG